MYSNWIRLLYTRKPLCHSDHIVQTPFSFLFTMPLSELRPLGGFFFFFLQYLDNQPWNFFYSYKSTNSAPVYYVFWHLKCGRGAEFVTSRKRIFCARDREFLRDVIEVPKSERLRETIDGLWVRSKYLYIIRRERKEDFAANTIMNKYKCEKPLRKRILHRRYYDCIFFSVRGIKLAVFFLARQADLFWLLTHNRMRPCAQIFVFLG